MRNLILGTDWWDDCDDCVAVRLLARYVRDGKVNLLGVGINACMEYSAASIHAMLMSEGVRVPVGVARDATDFGSEQRYQKRLASYTEEYKNNEGAEDAVRLYRRLIAEADGPVEIMEIGFLNVIAGAIESQPDDISDKSGVELFKEKVSKVWVMGGKWDEDGGKENNFFKNERARRASSVFCEKCPVPVTFLGFEVGNTVLTADNLKEPDILLDALRDHGSGEGRLSWDPMLVMLALIGDEAEAGYDTVCGTASVELESGANHFEINENGLHKYVIKNKDDSFYKSMINEVIK